MLNLPAEITIFLAQFAPVFSPSVWYHAQVLLDWGSVDTWETDRQRDFVSDGAASECTFSELSLSAQ